jgi:hypothetical protein
MARISANVLDPNYQEGITLDRYQELLGLPICAFNGLNNPAELNDYVCTSIWRQHQRDYVARFLASAEEMREQELGFFIAPKYISKERQKRNSPVILNRKWLIQIGEQTDTSILDSVPLSLSYLGTIYDPVVITVPTSVTETSEILVTYENEMVVIHPSNVTIVGGNAVISIPRSRLVKPALNDDREDPLDYSDDANFVTAVDVYRRWYDISKGVEIVSWLSNSFTESVSYGYAEIENHRTAMANIYYATWSGLIPSPACEYTVPCSEKKFMRVNYLSGRQTSIKVELETVRLAHTLMPHTPCECEAINMFWSDDVNTKEEYDLTPYGNKAGAMNAWLSDSRSKIGFGSFIGGMRK